MPRTKHFGSGFGSGSKDQSSGSRVHQQKSRPTHFLCFPIASDDTVPKITEALGYWREVTTKPTRQIPVRRREGNVDENEASEGLGGGSRSFMAGPDVQDRNARQDSNGNSDGDGDVSLSNVQRPTTATLAERLRILPPIVTRQAGTYHLTLGVMNLDDEGQKEKALEILHGLDLKDLLEQAEKGPPAGYKPARKWEDKRSEGTGDDKGGATAIRDETNVIEGNDLTESKLSAADSGSQDQRPQQLHISLTGLGGFPSLKNAGVLWARPKEQAGLSNGEDWPSFRTTDRLYNFALHLIQPFREAGIITETRPLALHATVANMRFAKQTSKANKWQRRTSGFRPEQVDAREIGKVWNEFDGKVELAAKTNLGAANIDEDDQLEEQDDETSVQNKETSESQISEHPFIWIRDIEINRVAICKLGASKHEDPLWGEWYPAIENGERLVFER